MTDKEIFPDKHVYARIQHYYQHLKERLQFYNEKSDVSIDNYEEIITEIECVIEHLEKIFPDIIYKA
jgi:hypothetical protein